MKNYWNTLRADWRNNIVAGGLFALAVAAWVLWASIYIAVPVAAHMIDGFSFMIPITVTGLALMHLLLRPLVRLQLNLGAGQ